MIRRSLRRFSAAVGGSPSSPSTPELPLFERVQLEAAVDRRNWNMKKQVKGLYDPVQHQIAYEDLMRKSAAPSNQRGSTILRDDNFSLSPEDYRRWMDLEKACLVLQMKTDTLSGLTLEQIDAAWRPLYMQASNQREQAEILAAAQTLMEYIGTPLYDERKRYHFAEVVRKARADIEETARRDKRQMMNRATDAFTWGQLFVTVLFVFGGCMAMGQMRKKDMDGIFERTKRKISVFISSPTNDEPAPDYATRYRDTPTTLDEYLSSPLPEIDDPVAIAIAEEVALQDRKEQALLAELSHELPEPYAPSEAEKEVKKLSDVSVSGLVRLVQNTVPSSMQRQVTDLK